MRIAIAAVIMAVMLVTAAVFMFRMRHTTKMRKAAFLLYLVGQILAALYLFYLVIFYNLSAVLFGLCVGMGLLCVPVDFALYYVLTVAEKQREAKERVRLLEEQQKALEEQQKRLDVEAAKASKVQAEVVAELESILADLDARDDASADLDFGKMLSIMDSTGRRVCRHHVVGALLASKQEEAEKAGVEVDFDLDVADDLPFSDTELCAVFSNLFDNAANACTQVPEGERRFIEMKVYSRDAFFIVDVVNSCSKAQMKRERRRDALFSEHGWGLSIIQAVAERHGGMLETEQRGSRFHTTVAMSLAAQGSAKG